MINTRNWYGLVDQTGSQNSSHRCRRDPVLTTATSPAIVGQLSHSEVYKDLVQRQLDLRKWAKFSFLSFHKLFMLRFASFFLPVKSLEYVSGTDEEQPPCSASMKELILAINTWFSMGERGKPRTHRQAPWTCSMFRMTRCCLSLLAWWTVGWTVSHFCRNSAGILPEQECRRIWNRTRRKKRAAENSIVYW